MARFRLRIALLSLIALSVTRYAVAWGNEGHRAVAIVAEGLLARVQLKHVPPGLALQLSQIATCPDEVRSFERNPKFRMSKSCKAIFPTPPTGTANWHFIDLDINPPDKTDAEIDQFCKNDCVVAKIIESVDALRKPSSSLAQRRQALSFLVHFVGDIHQPLHAAERNNDHGGNLLTVQFVQTPNGTRSVVDDNLHAVWDSGIIDNVAADEQVFVEDLSSEIAAAAREMVPQDFKHWVHDWARVSRVMAKTDAYRDKNAQIPAQPPHLLSPAYEATAESDVKNQIARAGFHLATLIRLVFQ